MTSKPSIYDEIYGTVRQVPRGTVATYGQIARIVGRCTPRMVGYAMAALRHASDVPWQRVINSRGMISIRSSGEPDANQRSLLEGEGIRFDQRDRIDLERYGWAGPAVLVDRGHPQAANFSLGKPENAQ